MKMFHYADRCPCDSPKISFYYSGKIHFLFWVGLSNDLELTTINNRIIRVTVNPDTGGREISSFSIYSSVLSLCIQFTYSDSETFVLIVWRDFSLTLSSMHQTDPFEITCQSLNVITDC